MDFDEIMVVGAGGGWNRRPVWLHSGSDVGCCSVTLAGGWEGIGIVNRHFYDVLEKNNYFFDELKKSIFLELVAEK